MADDNDKANDTEGKQDETKDEKVVFTPEQQAAIDKIVGGARTKAREQAKAEFEAAQAEAKKKAEEEAETARLKEEKRYTELITQHETKLTKIEPALEAAEAKLKAFGEMAEGMLNQQLEALGEAAKTAVEALPGEPDILAKLHWLTANEELFKTEEPPARGTPPRRGATSSTLQKKKDAERPPVSVNF